MRIIIREVDFITDKVKIEGKEHGLYKSELYRFAYGIKTHKILLTKIGIS